MTKKLVPLFLFFCLLSFAQEKLPYIDFQEISKLVTETSQNGDFEKTLEILDKVNINDSAYCSVMLSKSYYLMTLKKYDQAVDLIDEGIEKNCGDLKVSFYVNKGVALLNQKKYEEATDAIDKGIKAYPKNSLLWYNKGVLLEFREDIENAVVAYQNAIILNPFYRKSYLQLGNICYKQERISQALMCYNMYLLLEPDGENAFNILNTLDNLVKNKNENSRDPSVVISQDDDAFEEIDLIISNRIALNTNYKTGNEIDIALIRQNHALLQQLKDFSGNGGFWDTKFVPFYKWILDNGYFDIFTYTIAYSIENEKYKPVIEKNVKDIPDFLELSKSKWSEIAGENEMLWYGNTGEIIYLYKNDYVQAAGKMNNDQTIGPWEFYNETGRLTGKGRFNDMGKREGEWEWLNEFGKLRETAVYSNDKVNGKYKKYHDNGKPEIDANYIDDNLDGEYKYYNDKGALIQKKFFKNGDLDGLYMSYFNVGEKLPEYKILYNEGLVKGKTAELYVDGDLYSEMNFSNGKQNGSESKYHLNGKLSSEANYENGELEGSYRSFYSNGNPYEVGQSSSGLYDGSWKNYYNDGTIQVEYSYDKGDLNGSYKYYDNDGKLYYEYEYRKGEVLAWMRRSN